MYKNFSVIYDEFMKEMVDYDKWVDFAIENISVIYDEKASVLDIGCGTGEFSLRLIKRGYNVSGTDISPEMIDVFSKKQELVKKKVELYIEDICDLKQKKKYDVVFSFFDTLNHILTQKDLKKAFKNVYNILNINGIFMFDLATKELMEAVFENNIFYKNTETLTTIWEKKYLRSKKIYEINTMFFIKNMANYEKFEETYFKKIFNLDKIYELLLSMGFLVKIIYNDEIAGPRAFFVAVKY